MAYMFKAFQHEIIGKAVVCPDRFFAAAAGIFKPVSDPN
jgi:hypothetical protein